MDAHAIRIDKIVHDCVLGFERKRPEDAMRVAYRKVFLEALEAIPRSKLPENLSLICLMVQACKFASTAAFIEHATGELVGFNRLTGEGVYNWLVECYRFLGDTLEYWDELPPTNSDASQPRELLAEHVKALKGIVENVNELIHQDEDPEDHFTLPTAWFRQIEEFTLTLLCFWMDSDAEKSFRRQLGDDCRALEEYQLLSTMDGTVGGDV